MQKKLIALAVAGLAAAPAFAQSNVTIYGVVDAGYGNFGDSRSDQDSRNAIDSGLGKTSRIGFKGVEDLGNGLKAAFVLEYGLAVDQKQGINDGNARDQYVALVGNFGTVALGRQKTPQKVLLESADPFGGDYVTQVNTLWGYTVAGRIDNLAAYVSPSFGGFNVVAGYSFNASGNESKTTSGLDADLKTWAINPNYSNGPLKVGLNYHKVTAETLDIEDKVLDLVGSYDFGAVKLGLAYGKDKLESSLGTLADYRKWMVGASAPVGAAGTLMVSYIQSKEKEADIKARMWGLGYKHALSKRTSLYGVYGDMNNSDGMKTNYLNTSAAGFGTGDYERAITLGVTHQF
ncbi:MAG: porin [Rhodocyclaceae bacterium]|jgi:predicted porin|nr:porin [Rhodocyclaceae bacterium]